MTIQPTSIRNKRLAIERVRSPYVLLPLNDESANTLEMRVEELDVILQFTLAYPFHPPKILVNGIDHITKLLEDYRNLNPLRESFKLDLPCICCSNVICLWSPCSGFTDVLNEFVEYDALMKRLLAYADLMHKLPFDLLIHRHVLEYLL